MQLGSFLTFIQLFFAVVIGLYFWNLLKTQQSGKVAVDRESRNELDKLRKLRAISLTEPLSERTRPSSFTDIVGQADGLRALRAALCGPNPQHVLIYGSPGVGKTAAARLVLEEAKRNPGSPFKSEAKFVEMDATIARFDERGIADPLIGSVHDPIYQGAGPMGVAGIPQPKPGAVTKAHGGILFLDEIGELHPIQLNKLLKVLEDRKVFLESAYYNSEDPNIPRHIQDMFNNGLPADFRLVGATTRLPQELPPALRSRCMEVFFRPLLPDEVEQIAANAARKVGFPIERGALEVIKRYATNGREAVNIVQIAAGVAMTDGRSGIATSDVEWVVHSGQYNPRPDGKVGPAPQIGSVNGLAVSGPMIGHLLEIEVSATPCRRGRGKLTVTGMIEEEEVGGPGRVVRRKSMARGSVENVLTVLRRGIQPDIGDYDIHVNFPGGTPVDGPSAGVAIAVAVCSAVRCVPVDNRLSLTGELSIRGFVKPVGGVAAKVQAARHAGCDRVLIPRENWQEMFAGLPGTQVIPIERLEEALDRALVATEAKAQLVPEPEAVDPLPVPALHAPVATASPRQGMECS